jgi:uncharacterized protein (TIGR03435 family)
MLASALMFASFTLLFQPSVLATAAEPPAAAPNSPVSQARHKAQQQANGFASDSSAGFTRLRSAADVLVAAVDLLRRAFGSSASIQPPVFEAISIKPGRSGAMRVRVSPNGDLSASAVPVIWLLHLAYDVPLNPSPRLSGLPSWRETYDIEAKAPANLVVSIVSEREKRPRIQSMIRGLLAERFNLGIRVEPRTMPVYALTVASGGLKLQKSMIAEKDCTFDTDVPDSCHNFMAGRGHPLNADAVTIDDIARYIENWADLPVINRTSVDGLFRVQTEGWAPMRLPPPPPGNAPAARFDDLPTIFTVLGTLGLELKKLDAEVPIYTVERIERPSTEG